MSRQPQSAYTSSNGPNRDGHRRDRTRLHGATYDQNGNFVYYCSTPHSTHAPQQDQNQHLSYVPHNHSNAEHNLDAETPPRYRRSGPSQSDPPQDLSQYHEVPRSWHRRNEDIHRMLQDPLLSALDGHTEVPGHQHCRYDCQSRSSLLPLPLYNGHYHTQTQIPTLNQHETRPLGMSNLQELNHHNSNTNPIEREGPFDAIGYVGQRSDYERRRDFEVGGSDQASQDIVETENWNEYDDRGSTLR